MIVAGVRISAAGAGRPRTPSLSPRELKRVREIAAALVDSGAIRDGEVLVKLAREVERRRQQERRYFDRIRRLRTVVLDIIRRVEEATKPPRCDPPGSSTA